MKPMQRRSEAKIITLIIHSNNFLIHEVIQREREKRKHKELKHSEKEKKLNDAIVTLFFKDF